MHYSLRGGYDRRKYIMSQYDLDSLFGGEEIDLGCDNSAEIIHP